MPIREGIPRNNKGDSLSEEKRFFISDSLSEERSLDTSSALLQAAAQSADDESEVSLAVHMKFK